MNAMLITPFVRSAAEQSNSSNASSCDCKTGNVFNSFSEFMVRSTPSSLLKLNEQYSITIIKQLD